MLKQLWSSSKGLDSLFSYLQDKIYEVWRALAHSPWWLRAPDFQLCPVFQKSEPSVCPAKEFVKVFLYLGLCPCPCVLWLLLIGLILCNRWETQPTRLPPCPNLNWLEGYWGLYCVFPGPCQPLSPPEMHHPTPRRGRPSSPHFPDSDCVYTVPLIWGLIYWLSADLGMGDSSLKGISRPMSKTIVQS